MKSITLILLTCLSTFSFAEVLPRPVVPTPSHPIPNPGVDTNTLICMAGSGSSMSLTLTVTPDGRFIPGSMMYIFKKATHAVTIGANNQTNLAKGECGFVGTPMATSAGVRGTFWDANVASKPAYVTFNKTYDAVNSNGQIIPVGETQTATVPGYEKVMPGVVFKVSIHLDNTNNMIVDTNTNPTFL